MYSKRHLLLYYYKYKDSPYYSLGIFVIIMIVSIMLLMKVVLPQMNSWFSINNEVTETTKRIATINDNIRYVSSLDEQDLIKKRTVIVRAMPFDKDFQGILSTISSSAIISNVALDDFTLTIGELEPKTTTKSLSTLTLGLSLKGTAENMKKFIVSVQTRIPLAEVTSIDLQKDTAQIDLAFYYKALPVFKVTDSDPIQRISGKFDSISSVLQQWTYNTDNSQSIASTSASPSTR